MPAAQPQSSGNERASELIRGFDLSRLSRTFLDDPYPTYRALRELAPIHRLPDGSFFLTRYDDLANVYRDTATWSSDKKVDFRPNFADSLLYEHHTTSLVFNDPPIHTRVRKLLAPAFTPRALRALEPRIEALVDRLLDEAADRGVLDLIDDFAAAIPMQLIGDLLGDRVTPARDGRAVLARHLEHVADHDHRQRPREHLHQIDRAARRHRRETFAGDGLHRRLHRGDGLWRERVSDQLADARVLGRIEVEHPRRHHLGEPREAGGARDRRSVAQLAHIATAARVAVETHHVLVARDDPSEGRLVDRIFCAQPGQHGVWISAVLGIEEVE